MTKHSEEHGGVLNCELNISAQYNSQPLGRIVNGLDALARSCREPLEALDRHCNKERFLVPEMMKLARRKPVGATSEGTVELPCAGGARPTSTPPPFETTSPGMC
jgi:hypothetical protein